MTKEEARFSVMGAISMALKDSTLQQGFEIICKNLSELEETNAKLQAKIDDWQSEYIELENFKNNEIAELEKENTELKDKLNNLSKVAEVRLANWQKYEQENAELRAETAMKLTEATKIIRGLLGCLYSVEYDRVTDLEEAEQFVKDVRK